MSTIVKAQAEETVNASAERVYAILSDYRDSKQGHPAILPPENFSDLIVEEGGRGEGTVLSFSTKAGGSTRAYRVKISEPEPGKVLREDEIGGSVVTTFTVTPVEEKRCRVLITTEYEAPDGFVESLLSPSLLKRIYKKELHNLETIAGRAN